MAGRRVALCRSGAVLYSVREEDGGAGDAASQHRRYGGGAASPEYVSVCFKPAFASAFGVCAADLSAAQQVHGGAASPEYMCLCVCVTCVCVCV